MRERAGGRRAAAVGRTRQVGVAAGGRRRVGRRVGREGSAAAVGAG